MVYQRFVTPSLLKHVKLPTLNHVGRAYIA